MKTLLPLMIAVVAAAGTAGNNDVLLSAMNDELARTVTQLHIEKHDKPYYVSYAVDDCNSLNMTASFGAITYDRSFRWRTSSVDVHVGSYSMDSGNVGNNFSFWDVSDSGNFPVEDDYDAIRHKLWLQTDSAYKRAVQNLEKKKASNLQKNVKDRPDDWSHEEPVVSIQEKEPFAPDAASWKASIKKLSTVFKNYPKIRESSVAFSENASYRYFINNEGSKSREPLTSCTITVSATAQGKDGIKAESSFIAAAINEKKLPSNDQLEAKAKQLAQRLSEAVDAKELDIYQGPVLFEGEAAATFFAKALAPKVVAERTPDSDRPFRTESPVQDRVGRRILPTFIDVIDDPKMKDASGDKILGSYDVDNEGVRAKQVTVVEKGILKTLLSTRLPTRKVKVSNGHATGSGSIAEISNLVVQTANPASPEELRAKLRQLGTDEGLEYVLVVRKMGALSSNGGGAIYFSGGSRNQRDQVNLPVAVDVSRIYVLDGHEEPVRPTEFSGATMRILRDIVATGADSQTYPLTEHNDTLTTPSVIVTDVEMHEAHGDTDKNPILPHPYFEEKKMTAD